MSNMYGGGKPPITILKQMITMEPNMSDYLNPIYGAIWSNAEYFKKIYNDKESTHRNFLKRLFNDIDVIRPINNIDNDEEISLDVLGYFLAKSYIYVKCTMKEKEFKLNIVNVLNAFIKQINKLSEHQSNLVKIEQTIDTLMKNKEINNNKIITHQKKYDEINKMLGKINTLLANITTESNYILNILLLLNIDTNSKIGIFLIDIWGTTMHDITISSNDKIVVNILSQYKNKLEKHLEQQIIVNPLEKFIGSMWNYEKFQFHMILIIVWWKISNVNDLNIFYNGINKGLENSSFPLLILSPRTDSYTENELLESKYGINYQNDIAKLIFMNNQFTILDFKSMTEKTLCNNKFIRYSDCASTSLRTFFMIWLWDDSNNKYDISLLKSFDASIKLITFFETFSTHDLQRDDTIKLPIFDKLLCARQAWLYIVNNHQGIHYNKKCTLRENSELYHYEISSEYGGRINMFNLVKILLPKLTSWLNFNHDDVIIEIIDNDDENADFELLFNAIYIDCKYGKYVWEFSPGHFEIINLNDTKIKYDYDIRRYSKQESYFIDMVIKKKSIIETSYSIYQFWYKYYFPSAVRQALISNAFINLNDKIEYNFIVEYIVEELIIDDLKYINHQLLNDKVILLLLKHFFHIDNTRIKNIHDIKELKAKNETELNIIDMILFNKLKQIESIDTCHYQIINNTNEIVSLKMLEQLKHLNMEHQTFYFDDFPESLQTLKMSKNTTFEQVLKCNNLTSLTFNNEFNQPVGELEKYSNMLSITFGVMFNQPINALSSCIELKTLTFGRKFNQHINALSSCIELKTITFGDDFNQPIDALLSCVQLETLTFEYEFNQPIDALLSCVKLKTLTFGDEFNQPIDALLSCVKLETLTFEYAFNQHINALSSCVQLKTLTFGVMFNQPIDALSSCVQLKTLAFGDDFNQYINKLESCVQLKTITFGEKFNQPVDVLSNNHKITLLTFGKLFNQPINALLSCIELKTLTFGRTFNQSIDALSSCIELKTLTFGGKFNQSINALLSCIELKTLTFGVMFNQPIDALSSCVKLETLTFGEKFNQPIGALSSCIELKTLTFGKLFNQPVDVLSLCIKLETLTLTNLFNYNHTNIKSLIFGSTFNQSIHLMNENCYNLRTITFGRTFNQPINALSQCAKLETITFGDDFNQLIHALSQCAKLETITFGEKFNQPVDVLSQCAKLETITFGDDFNQLIHALKSCVQLKTITFGKLFNQPINALSLCVKLKTLTFSEMFDQHITDLLDSKSLVMITLRKSYPYATPDLEQKLIVLKKLY